MPSTKSGIQSMRPRPTDYQYYEDAADAEREDGAGTLLPLWKFEFSLPGPLEVLLSKALLIIVCTVLYRLPGWPGARSTRTCSPSVSDPVSPTLH